MLAPLAAALLSVTAPASAPPPAVETLRTMTDVAARMTLPTQINGRGPFAFTIDTGADRSVVSDSLAAELGLPRAGGATIVGIVGPQPVSVVHVERLQVGRRAHHTIAAPVLPRTALGASGFVGLDALAGESVLLDFGKHRISIARSPREAMVDDPDVIVVTGRSRFGQLILTDARVNGRRIYAIVDTGAENSVANLAFRRLMGRKGPLKDDGARIIGVTGAELPAEPGIVPQIMLGTMTVSNMAVVYADVQTFARFGVGDKPALLIGMDLLRSFERVALDFQRRKVRFRMGDGHYDSRALAGDDGGARAPAKGTPLALGL